MKIAKFHARFAGKGFMDDGELSMLLIEHEQTDVDLFTLALRESRSKARLSIVGDVPSGMDYLLGSGIYEDRKKYPFPDIVVFGLLLPIVSGLDFLKWCRTNEVCKLLPLVVWTGALQGEKEVLDAMQYKPDLLYFKSGDFETLTKILREILDLGMERKGKSKGRNTLLSQAILFLSGVVAPC